MLDVHGLLTCSPLSPTLVHSLVPTALAEKLKYTSRASKTQIPWVMFACFVCAPLRNANGKVVFDGKIGLFPLVHYDEPAEKKSEYFARGDIRPREETMNADRFIDKYCIGLFMTALIDKVLPDAPWVRTWTLQIDGAGGHGK